MNKLINKAKGIRFDDEEPAGADKAADERPRTAIGAISASLAMGRGIEAENRDLRERLRQFEDATVVEFLDPQHIHASRWANRHELSFGGPEFAALKAEIASAGRNVQPIKVRPLKGRSGEYEVAFGHRRHRACLDLGLPVAAIVEELTDAELFVQMDRENRERQNLTAWEQGVMYRRALDEGLYPSLRQLAASIGAQVGNVSTALQLATLPPEVLSAFDSPLALQYRWAAPLKAALDQDAERVVNTARELAGQSPKLPAREVFARLTAPKAGPPEARSQAFMAAGKAAGSFERDARGAVVIRLKPGVLPPLKERRLLEFIQKQLEG